MPLVLAEVVGRYWRADWIAPLMGRGLVETVEFIPDLGRFYFDSRLARLNLLQLRSRCRSELVAWPPCLFH